MDSNRLIKFFRRLTPCLPSGRAGLLFVAMLLPSCLLAQREYSPNFAIGGKAGATLSSVSFSPEVHTKFAQGLTMGIAARYTEEKYFGLIAEVNFTQRGWAEDFTRDEAPQFNYTRTLNYISIPLLTQFREFLESNTSGDNNWPRYPRPAVEALLTALEEAYYAFGGGLPTTSPID
uniref:outer membrane beta-barrel protein n=1 Tax=uncultured Duncaniella sp. TaxID=2768039 RepID=UPI002674B0F7